MSHTPEPWEVVETAKGFRIMGPRRETTLEEQIRFGCSPGSVIAPSICDLKLGQESDANARIIAAAPSLLAACQLAMQFWYSDQPNDTPESVAAKHAIRAAIASATGEGAKP